MRKVTAAEVSTPVFATPPLSLRRTVTVALPEALGVGLKLKVPVAEIVG